MTLNDMFSGKTQERKQFHFQTCTRVPKTILPMLQRSTFSVFTFHIEGLIKENTTKV